MGEGNIDVEAENQGGNDSVPLLVPRLQSSKQTLIFFLSAVLSSHCSLLYLLMSHWGFYQSVSHAYFNKLLTVFIPSPHGVFLSLADSLSPLAKSPLSVFTLRYIPIHYTYCCCLWTEMIDCNGLHNFDCVDCDVTWLVCVCVTVSLYVLRWRGHTVILCHTTTTRVFLFVCLFFVWGNLLNFCIMNHVICANRIKMYINGNN